MISNNDVVHVYFKSNLPQPTDFIAAYSPSNVNINYVAPVMYGNCNSDPGYISTGNGMLNFQFTNLREDGM